MEPAAARRRMVERQLAARGVRDPAVLAAMGRVPREAFVGPELAEHAYEDRALPIEAGRVLPQPFVVARMVEALALGPGDDVLEVGCGAGYAAAVLACLARRVFAVEGHPVLAELARARLAALGFGAVEVRCGDGARGWAAHAPYPAIALSSGGPDAPPEVLAQLAVGGRLVVPFGDGRAPALRRITRRGASDLAREELGAATLVPRLGGGVAGAEPGAGALAGATAGALPARAPTGAASPAGGAWAPASSLASSPASSPASSLASSHASSTASSTASVARLIAACAEPITTIADAPLDGLLDRIGRARVVLLGEATHGTSEFYRMRTRITQALILRRGFRAVALEADWPDVATLDRHVRGLPPRRRSWAPFARFPSWMWRNRETLDLVAWLRAHNQAAPGAQVCLAGLDLYSLATSAEEVVRYLGRVDPVAARTARARYERLTPWQADPAAYGLATLRGTMRSCEGEVVAMLREVLAQRLAYAPQDGEDFLDAARNAAAVAGAEAYYRTMYYGAAEAWNLRDQHMFDTLRALRAHLGEDAGVVVWEHNAHVGDAAATELAARGEHSVGHLCRRAYGDGAYLIGFGTDRGALAAAEAWGGPMGVRPLAPARPDSYEHLCHAAGVPAFLLALREPARAALREELLAARLERAIGAVYLPHAELASHYLQAVLPVQFDEYVWFDETTAIEPLPASVAQEAA